MSSRVPSTAPSVWQNNWDTQGSAQHVCRATSHRISASRQSKASAMETTRFLSPPILPHAASMYRRLPMSSTMICLIPPTPTLTASAERAESPEAGRPSPLSRVRIRQWHTPLNASLVRHWNTKPCRASTIKSPRPMVLFDRLTPRGKCSAEHAQQLSLQATGSTAHQIAIAPRSLRAGADFLKRTKFERLWLFPQAGTWHAVSLLIQHYSGTIFVSVKNERNRCIVPCDNLLHFHGHCRCNAPPCTVCIHCTVCIFLYEHPQHYPFSVTPISEDTGRA